MAVAVIGAVRSQAGDLALDAAQQSRHEGRIAGVAVSQPGSGDPAGAGVVRQVQLEFRPNRRSTVAAKPATRRRTRWTRAGV